MSENIIKLDLGCGGRKQEGFIGIDQYHMEGVDIVLNIGEERFPFDDNSVDEIHSSHFLEHLSMRQRTHVMNECYRIMKEGAKGTFITPHWASNRAYGDITHDPMPVSEMFYYYLKQDWRNSEAPHTDIKWNPNGLSCDFDASWGYSYSPELNSRNQEYIQFALMNFKDSAQDMIATIIKPRKLP
jgi:hypothetical protein